MNKKPCKVTTYYEYSKAKVGKKEREGAITPSLLRFNSKVNQIYFTMYFLLFTMLMPFCILLMR